MFARDGYQLILVARETPRLTQAVEEVAALGATVLSAPQDLARPGAAAELTHQITEQHQDVDVLVNNAGFAVFGAFVHTDLAQEQELLQLNVVALTELTKLLLPGMLSRGGGRILNVASTAAFLPGPLMACYYASKAYVLSLSQALSSELEGTGVTVTVLCPGPTWSGFQARAGIEGIRMLGRFTMSSEAVARVGYAGLMQGKRLVVPGWHNELVRLGAKLAPTGLLLRAVRSAQQHRPGYERQSSPPPAAGDSGGAAL